jgi:hypothetical protein
MKKYTYYSWSLFLMAMACAGLFLTACDTTGGGSSGSASAQPAGMTGSTSKNAGTLIVQRAANMGTDLTLNVWLDGKQIAELGLGQTYSGPVSAGPHKLSALVVPNRVGLQPTRKTLNVTAGQTYNFTGMWKGERLVLM